MENHDAPPTSNISKSLASFGAAWESVSKAFQEFSRVYLAKELREFGRIYLSIAEKEYRKRVGPLPGTTKTKRGRKKRRKIVLLWFANYLANGWKGSPYDEKIQQKEK